jgi:hypothetical protein
LASDIVKSILDGRQPAEMTLAVLMRPFALHPQVKLEPRSMYPCSREFISQELFSGSSVTIPAAVTVSPARQRAASVFRTCIQMRSHGAGPEKLTSAIWNGSGSGLISTIKPRTVSTV